MNAYRIGKHTATGSPMLWRPDGSWRFLQPHELQPGYRIPELYARQPDRGPQLVGAGIVGWAIHKVLRICVY